MFLGSSLVSLSPLWQFTFNVFVLFNSAWMELFIWCCFGFVLFVTLCRKPIVFRSCCLSFFFERLHMLANTGSRFFGFIFNLFVLLSLDAEWLISFIVDLFLSYDKWLGALDCCFAVEKLREFFRLDVFVVDGTDFFFPWLYILIYLVFYLSSFLF